MPFNYWKHPKTNKQRVYLNGVSWGLKIFAERLEDDSYRVTGYYEDISAVPQEYRNCGNRWAINIFVDQLEKEEAPEQAIRSFDALLDFASVKKNITIERYATETDMIIERMKGRV